tara:strand:+ start:53467 stop:53700 length:234 start_codon:yes stop_codon:yes gene_type:complete
VQRVVLAFIKMLIDEFFDSISSSQRCVVVGFKVEFDAHDDPDFGRRALVNLSLPCVDSRTRSRKFGGNRPLQRHKRR